jgi:hypothetical protein
MLGLNSPPKWGSFTRTASYALQSNNNAGMLPYSAAEDQHHSASITQREPTPTCQAAIALIVQVVSQLSGVERTSTNS